MKKSNPINLAPTTKPQPVVVEVEAEEIPHDENGLMIIPTFDANGLEKTDAQKTLELFTGMFEELAKWEHEERSIVVESENDVEAMEYAKQLRLAVRDIRTNGERTKKKAKEKILLQGNYIDGIWNSLQSLCKMVENRALEKEETVERLMQAARLLVYNERAKKLEDLGYNHANLDLINMPDEIFEQTMIDAADLKALRDKRTADAEAAQKELDIIAENNRVKNELNAKRLQEFMKLGLTTLLDLSDMNDEDYLAYKNSAIKQKQEADDLAEKNRLELQAKKDRWNKRDRELEALGFGLDKQKGRCWISALFKEHSIVVSDKQIEELGETEWKKEMKKIKTQLAIYQTAESEEAERLAILLQLKIERNAQLDLLDQRAFVPSSRINIELFSSEDWDSLYKNFKVLSDEIKKQDEEEVKRKRKELQSDSENIIEYFDSLLAIELPVISIKMLHAKLISFQEAITAEKLKILKIMSKD